MRSELDIEIFSCAGGMALGFHRAGIDFGMVVDKDPNAVASYAANLGHRPIQMDARDLLRMLRLRVTFPPVRLLVADPPCTPWSTAGKKLGLEDDRDMLRQTVEIIRLLRPRAYLIGNVPGLETAPNIPVVQATIGSLAAEGYCTADYARLDAADYGTPQHRSRPFWYGHLAGPCLRWPTATHGDPGRLALPGLALAPWVTCRDALGHLSREELGTISKLRKRSDGDPRASSPDRPARVVTTRSGSGDGTTLLLNKKHPPSSPDAPARTQTTNPGRGSRYLALGGGGLGRISRGEAPARTQTTTNPGYLALLEADWPDAPSTTVYAGTNQLAAPGKGSPGRRAVIRLSEKARAILQGFPEDWRFVGGTKKARDAQIGQAMPPQLAEAVARSIVEQLAATPSQPSRWAEVEARRAARRQHWAEGKR